jgi:hypothetical protein
VKLLICRLTSRGHHAERDGNNRILLKETALLGIKPKFTTKTPRAQRGKQKAAPQSAFQNSGDSGPISAGNIMSSPQGDKAT